MSSGEPSNVTATTENQMATTTQSTTEQGFRRMLEGARASVQVRMKDVEKVWSETYGQLNSRLQTAESDVREFVQRLEGESTERLQSLRGQLKLDELLGKLNAEDLEAQVNQTLKTAIASFGFAKQADLDLLVEEVANLKAQLAETRKRANSSATKSTVTKLTKRVAALEK